MLLFFCFAVILVGCNKNESPKQAFEEYINLWNDREFANMYDRLSEHAQKRFLKGIHREISKIYEGLALRI